MQPPNPCTSWSQLAHVLPVEQREQLAAIILAKIQTGWGCIELIIKDHHILEFRNTDFVPAIKPKVDP
jgi:hypothetical protein